MMSQGNLVEISLDNGKTWVTVQANQRAVVRWTRKDDNHILFVGDIDAEGVLIQEGPYDNGDRVFAV
jgi:beta-lactamase superfamily II metal-dependent hydrolase